MTEEAHVVEPACSPRRPLVVVETAATYADVLAEVAGAGWGVVSPHEPAGPTDCVEWSVATASDAARAIYSAASGRGVVTRLMTPQVHLVDPSSRTLAEDLVDDLASLGPVQRPRPTTSVCLDRLTWQLAHDLARGLTLEAAAMRAHISTRTANRRVGEAREALGAGTRAQLVLALKGPERVPPALIPR